MKKIYLSLIVIILLCTSIYSQNYPSFVQIKLDSAQIKSSRALSEYRIGGKRDFPYLFKLSYEFSEKEKKTIDSLGIIIEFGSIFNNEMRVRIVQLLNNEFNETELVALVSEYIRNDNEFYFKKTFDLCKFDTIQLYKTKLDSFYLDFKTKNKKDTKFEYMYKVYFFTSIKLDTTTAFKTKYKEIIKKDSIRLRNEYLISTNYNYTYIAELCGNINDKRFIKPLINALKKPDNFDSVKVIESLVRMKVEPYYKNYIESRTRTLDQIKKGEFDFEIKDFVFVLNTQESFLELSKYLLSDTPYLFFSDDSSLPVSYEAISLIKVYIENEELQKLVKTESYTKDDLHNIYNWMQKNYGKYKLKRIW